MAKIIIFGDIEFSPLWIRVDEGKELVITGKYPRSISVSSGTHYIFVTTLSKSARWANNIDTGNDFISNASRAATEHMSETLSGQIDFDADDVLLLQVKQHFMKTRVYSQMVKLAEVYSYVSGEVLEYGERVSGEKNKWAVFFLCLFFGFLGVHRFYEKKIGTGILYLFTFGLCGLGVCYDLIQIFRRSA